MKKLVALLLAAMMLFAVSAVSMAEEAGFEYVIRRPAPSSRVEYAANIMWEVIQELNGLKMRLFPV